MEVPAAPGDLEAQVEPVVPQVPPPVAATSKWLDRRASSASSTSSAASSADGSAQSGPEKQPGCFGALRGLLTPAQWLYCAFAVLVELLLVWLWQQDVTGSPSHDACIYNIAHLTLVCLYPRTAAAPVAQAAPAGQRGPAAAEAGGPSSWTASRSSSSGGSGGRARSFFLDGVKVFCTQLVLIHHVSIGFGAFSLSQDPGDTFVLGQYPGNTFGRLLTNWLVLPNQSWFMCMLFFVGGIFVPSSLERKGLAEYVRDKLNRLGWPLVVTYFVVLPLSWGFWGVVLCGGEGGVLSYMIFETGVTWFLASLLIFSIAYSILPFPQVTIIPMPSAVQIISACAALGAIQGWIYYCQFTLLYVGPLPLGALPFDVAFFAAGCVAKRSGWLDEIQSMAPRDYWLARLAALVAIVSTGGIATAVGLDELLSPRLGPLLLLGAWLGVMTGGISVSVLHFFAVHCNSSSRWQKLAGESQYAVYVLQAVTIPGVMYTLVLGLRTAGYTVEFEFSNGSPQPVSSSNELPQWVIVSGWIYTVALVTMISWPLGYLFRKLPLVRDVL